MDFEQSQSHTIISGQAGFAVPMMIAVTGHRDLVPEETPAIRVKVEDFFNELRATYPNRGVSSYVGTRGRRRSTSS
jgi:hypothetical protein